MKSCILISVMLAMCLASFAQKFTTLDASASKDTDGTITGWQWRQVSPIDQAGQVQWSSQTVQKPVVTFPRPDTYVFGVVVTDNRGGKSPKEDFVQIVINLPENKLPVADAGPDQVLTWPGTATINLKDPNKNVAWQKLSPQPPFALFFGVVAAIRYL